MNFHVLSWLLFFLAPGGCPIYSINVSTLEVPANDFQNALTLHTRLSSELQHYRDDLSKASLSPKSINEMPKVGRGAAKPVTFLGTNLFDSQRKSCFSMEEMALMSARRTMEQLVPKSYPNCLLTDSVVHMLIRFVNTVNRVVNEMSDEGTRLVPQRAFYDALGGYLRYYLVPAAQVSYYAGGLKLKTMQCLLKIKRQCHIVLNTNGNAWRSPSKDILCRINGFKIEPIDLGGTKPDDGAGSCSQLDQNSILPDADKGQMIVPLPQLEPVDSDGHLSNIFLPFRQRRIYNLRSPVCAEVLVRFFKTVTSCHKFQGMSQANYNHKLLNWIRENLHSHYIDEMFYPGLGGILQIQEMLQTWQKEQDACREDDNRSHEEGSHKVNRSIGDWHGDLNSKHEQQGKDEESAKKETVLDADHEEEECRDCDSWLVWYIAAFLVILLIIILLVIFFCMRRVRKRKDTDPLVPVDVEAPAILKIPQSMSKRQRQKSGEGRNTYYGEQAEKIDQSTSSLNCQFKKKCLPTKFSVKKQDYYQVVSEETSTQRPIVSLSSRQYNVTPSSEFEDRESLQKQKREKKRKGRKEGGSGQSGTAKSSVDKKVSSAPERRKANKVRIADTAESSYDTRQHRKKKDEARTGNSTRLKGGTASSAHSMKETRSWETTFDDI